MEQTFMKDKAILPLVLTMSLPMVLSMWVGALYNIVDSYFVAKISEDAMTALSLVFPIQNIANAVGIGFGVGLNAVAAYYLGAQKEEAANKAVSQGVLLSGIHGLVLTVVCIGVIPMFLKLFTADADVIAYGLDYSYIVFAFTAPHAMEVAFEKIFQSVGKMRVSMFSMLCACILNIILDPIFIFGLGFVPAMGVKGSALATGIAQSFGLIIYIVIFRTMELPVHFRLKSSIIDGKICKQMYNVGIPATLNMALPSLLITALNGILADFSQVYVFILGVYYKLQTFIYLTSSGIVQGIRPLVGYNYGAKRNDRVLKIMKVAFLLSAMVMLVGTLLCMFLPTQIMGLFSVNPQTIALGTSALRIISCGFLVSAISVIISGTFEGLGEGMPSLMISLIRYIAMIPIAFLLSYLIGVTGVWHSFWMTEGLAALFSGLLFFRWKKKHYF